MRSRKGILKELGNYSFYTLGCIIYAVGLVMFINPARLSAGGITGLATVFNYFINIPIGFSIIALNVPIIVAAAIIFGKKFIVRTSIVTVIFSVAIDITDAYLTPRYVEPILAAIFGGIIMGAGLSIIMYKGSTTGGIDILAKIINKKAPAFSIGNCILILDLAVILLNSLVFKSLESMLYTIIALFISTKVIDLVIYGAKTCKVIYVISPENTVIAKSILQNVNRGVTLIKTKGAYTNLERQMLMCVVRRHQASKVMEIVRGIDSSAFVIVSEASQVNGNGFE
ncbi:MAG: YitT family protein [Clostridia bacterium]|nr:YitT family protein [Clostridia bacterium]